MAETVIGLYLGHFCADFDEILYVEIFLPTWKAYKVSSRSKRLQGQRPQGHKGQRTKFLKINFHNILWICESITPTFEVQCPHYQSLNLWKLAIVWQCSQPLLVGRKPLLNEMVWYGTKSGSVHIICPFFFRKRIDCWPVTFTWYYTTLSHAWKTN